MPMVESCFCRIGISRLFGKPQGQEKERRVLRGLPSRTDRYTVMNVLEVKGLTKKYPAFTLDNAGFSLEKGKITGFIGRNGAGKTTTLKSIFGFVHPDSGEIRFWGKDFATSELDIKERVGLVLGGIDYYKEKKLKKITAVTKSFYKSWDDEAYKKYIALFAIDENKTPSRLSAGMRVKYALALALSHRAELLILDEPTSGLDPVSRSELLDIFMTLCDQGVTIMFSTHITSDLEACADNIIYISGGKVKAESSLHDFVNRYNLCMLEQKPEEGQYIGVKRAKNGYSALVEAGSEPADGDLRPATLDDILIHLEKEVMTDD